MHFGLSVQVDWAPDEEDFGAAFTKAKKAAGPRLKQLFDKLAKAFPKVPCEYDGLAMAELQTADESLLSDVVGWMDKQREKYQIVVVSYWSIEELSRARWLALNCNYAFADSDAAWNPLNQYPKILCNQCGWYDEAAVPTPYKVKDELLRRKEDVFGAYNGLLIVRESVKTLLTTVAGDQLEWGETCVVDSSGKRSKPARGKPDFFWIRPKALIGKNLDEWPDPEVCEKCRRLLGCGCRSDPDAKVVRNRTTIEYFGDKRLNIASGGSWFGSRTGTEGWNISRPMLLSGGLWAYLYNCGVKGMIVPEQGLYSAKAEAIVEPERRFPDLKTGKDDKFLRLKMPWQKKSKP